MRIHFPAGGGPWVSGQLLADPADATRVDGSESCAEGAPGGLACGVPADDVAQWTAARNRVSRAHRPSPPRTAAPAPDTASGSGRQQYPDPTSDLVDIVTKLEKADVEEAARWLPRLPAKVIATYLTRLPSGLAASNLTALQPELAAACLEQMPRAQASEHLETMVTEMDQEMLALPELTASVTHLHRMPPATAASLIAVMPVSAAAEWLNRLPAPVASRMVRHMPVRTREALAATAHLAELVAQGREISHALLDELPPGAALQHLRQMMVQTGVLPERHEDIERIPAWLEHHLADKPVEHANLIRPFLHWHLLRRARHRATRRAVPTTAGRDLRRRILVALDLLTWIDAERTTLADLRQDDLDRWLDDEKTQRRNRVRYFLGWTADRGLSRRLTVPAIPRQEPAEFLDDDQRWHLLHRCLTDETLPIEVRAAGALILLFALQAQHIRHLTADQLTENGDDAYLTVGRHPILLPPRLGALLRSLAARPPTPLMIPHGPNAPQWLFPGRIPGQPIDGHSLTNLLNRHGINVRPARNGALAALAADLPAAILADLLGLHVNTAVRWVTYARRDWTDYLALRAAEHSETPKE